MSRRLKILISRILLIQMFIKLYLNALWAVFAILRRLNKKNQFQVTIVHPALINI